MSIKDKVLETQAAIIDNLANCENAMSRLYEVYATSIPQMEDFWLDLSKEEASHAALLGSLHKQLAKGNIFWNIGKFDLKNSSAFLQKINDAMAYAKENPVSAKHGVRTALGLDSSILDAHFYDIVDCDAAEFKIIAKRLSEDTHNHVSSVQDKLHEITSQLR